MWASEGGYLDVVKELLRPQAGVDMEDEVGMLSVLGMKNHNNVVSGILERVV